MADYIDKEAMRKAIREQERLRGLKGLGWVEAAMDRLPTLTLPNEWVSVEEKLPEKDGSYLVHSGKSNTVYAAHFGKRDGRWSGKSKNLFITHWMPMPELPERSNNETD